MSESVSQPALEKEPLEKGSCQRSQTNSSLGCALLLGETWSIVTVVQVGKQASMQAFVILSLGDGGAVVQ